MLHYLLYCRGKQRGRPILLFCIIRWQRPICFYAQPTAPRQTLNDRLPFENSSHRPQTLGKTRFRRFPTFHFFDSQKKWSSDFRRLLEVFEGLSYYFEELHIFGGLWHLCHEKLHHVDLLSTLYDTKSGSSEVVNILDIKKFTGSDLETQNKI